MHMHKVIDELNADPECTGYIVQLPLPKHLDENAVLERIDPSKDADGLHPVNLDQFQSANMLSPSLIPASLTLSLQSTRRFSSSFASALTSHD